MNEKEVIINIFQTSLIKPLREQMKELSRTISGSLNDSDLVKISKKIGTSTEEVESLFIIISNHLLKYNLKCKENSKHAILKQRLDKKETKNKQYTITQNELPVEDVELIKTVAMIMNIYENTLNTLIIRKWIQNSRFDDEISTDLKKEIYAIAQQTNTPYNHILNHALREGAKKMKKKLWAELV